MTLSVKLTTKCHLSHYIDKSTKNCMSHILIINVTILRNYTKTYTQYVTDQYNPIHINNPYNPIHINSPYNTL